jgi:NADH:ubiquinone oxidoreductase subunit 5 (subunit L)/multisubunit Na+/H+ antiporter MnhA subunit
VALVVLITLLPWFSAVMFLRLRPILGRHIGRWTLLPPAASFLITLTFVPPAVRHQGFLYAVPWFPHLELNLSLWSDGLRLFYALLTVGVNLLIMWSPRFLSGPVGAHDRRCRTPLTGAVA